MSPHNTQDKTVYVFKADKAEKKTDSKKASTASKSSTTNKES